MRSIESLGLRVVNGVLEILDQTRLPREEIWMGVGSPSEMVEHIKILRVRGAPLIGVAAAMALAQFAESGASADELKRAALNLRAARPTAVNLMYAVDQILDLKSFESQRVIEKAYQIFEEDVALCDRIGELGGAVLPEGGVLTHCNAGGLATAGIGTAVGVIRRAFEKGKKIHVYVDETRPLLQGARLTTWELARLKIPFTLICDNMAGYLMQQGKIQSIVVGADRIARNRDFANKIGTYSLAVLAKAHGIPFYVAAPQTTVDPACATGADIVIEERAAGEVRRDWASPEGQVYNPAFDVTPARLVTDFFISA